MRGDFPRNLRLLTDHYKSVADVCRRLEINRSQFNKYLSGRSKPSRHILLSICDFFGVEEHEIVLPHRKFEEIVRVRSSAQPGQPSYISYLEMLSKKSRSDLSEYDGFYYEYSYSMTYPGMIIRALMWINTVDGATTYQRLENLASLDPPKPRLRGRYRGMAFYLNDRIFHVDFDAMTGDQISQTILYPTFENRHKLLPGLKLGVSMSSIREPLCARVVHVALGQSIDVRHHLKKCGILEPDSPDIDPKIRHMIENKIEDGAFHFRVLNQD